MSQNINNSLSNLVEKKIWAVGGGKGGVGKTVFTSNLGAALAKSGKKIVMVDVDLGGANLHTILGVKKVPYTLNDFIIKKEFKDISDIMVETPIENLKLISGANGILELANPNFAQKMKVINGLKKIEADIILLDLGAGTSFNILDFFNLADLKILVVCPEPTSIQNAYGFVKSAIYRKIVREFPDNSIIQGLLRQNRMGMRITSLRDICEKFNGLSAEIIRKYEEIFENFHPKIVMNMLRREEEKSMAHGIGLVSKKFLNVELEYVGHLYMDSFVMDSVQEMFPFVLTDNNHRTSYCIENILNKLLRCSERSEIAKRAVQSY